MTNEEKAKEIGKKYQTPCHGIGDCEFEAYQSAIEAMQWKDERHKQEKQQLIDKACEWINDQSFCGMIEYPADELIEEFKQAMKGE